MRLLLQHVELLAVALIRLQHVELLVVVLTRLQLVALLVVHLTNNCFIVQGFSGRNILPENLLLNDRKLCFLSFNKRSAWDAHLAAMKLAARLHRSYAN
jgi:hypothetical protein